jgi:hypothetical protein
MSVKKESWQEHNVRVLNLLVDLGFASDVQHDPVYNSTEIIWTEKGKALAREIRRIHQGLIKGRGKQGKKDAETLMNILVSASAEDAGQAALSE